MPDLAAQFMHCPRTQFFQRSFQRLKAMKMIHLIIYARLDPMAKLKAMQIH
jgi:hypothetical protein